MTEVQATPIRCPFCGCEETTPSLSSLTNGWAYLCCDACEACGPWVEVRGDTVDATARATAAWNVRQRRSAAAFWRGLLDGATLGFLWRFIGRQYLALTQRKSTPP